MSDLAHGELFEDEPPPPRRRPSAPFAAGSATSAEAAESIEGSAASLRSRVLRFIIERGDATCDEVEEALGLRHQTASARVYELVRSGRVIRTERRRRTRSGRNADVLEAAR